MDLREVTRTVVHRRASKKPAYYPIVKMSFRFFRFLLVLSAFVSVSLPGLYAASLTGLDFWFYEHLENLELRGGKAIQLNTRPLHSIAHMGLILKMIFLYWMEKPILFNAGLPRS